MAPSAGCHGSGFCAFFALGRPERNDREKVYNISDCFAPIQVRALFASNGE